MKTTASRRLLLFVFALGGILFAGCSRSSAPSKGTSPPPAFSLAWSEYPSWSVFGVAQDKKLIDGAEGKLGPIEKKWGVDIVLKEAGYDSCLNMYSAKNCDAVCITNMDVLSPALSLKSVAILPTSTSAGADACIVVGIDSVQALRGHKVYGLENSVSEYCFSRNLELSGEKESDHQFTNMDPAAAAVAMQTKSQEHKAIMVWNPFVLQTLADRKDARVLFDSSTIPGEIIDMVVMSEASLDKPGGKEFALAVIDTYYEMNKLLADKDTGADTLVALGEKFSRLGLDDMKKAVEQTRFYKSPDEALALFTGEQLKDTMKTVVGFCVSHQIVPGEPKIGYGNKQATPAVDLRFDPSYINELARKRQGG